MTDRQHTSGKAPPLSYETPRAEATSGHWVLAAMFAVVAVVVGAVTLTFLGIPGIVWAVSEPSKPDAQDVLGIIVANLIGFICVFAAVRWFIAGVLGTSRDARP
jgi:hypothetical protein